MNECARLIKKQRVKRGMTQFQLARRVRYETLATISKIERGIQSIPPEKIDLFAVHLGLPRKQLLEAIKRDKRQAFELHYEV